MYKQWEKPQEKKEEVVMPKIHFGISAQLMNERLEMCSNEPNLNRRLLMLERLKTQVERASIPYIDFLIQKTENKIGS